MLVLGTSVNTWKHLSSFSLCCVVYGIIITYMPSIRQIFRKRVFKLLLLNQPLRRKFVGSRLPTS
jgi:hypothetical protein